jgi:hypothetical protein
MIDTTIALVTREQQVQNVFEGAGRLRQVASVQEGDALVNG